MEQELVCWDQNSALKRVVNQESLLVNVLTLFIEEFPEHLHVLKQSISTNDCQQAARISHAIKGVASTVSGLQLEQIAAEFELSAKQQKMDVLINKLAELEQIAALLIQQINVYLSSKIKTEHSSSFNNKMWLDCLQSLSKKLAISEYISPDELGILNSTEGQTESVKQLAKELMGQINRFENESAMLTIDHIQKELNNNG